MPETYEQHLARVREMRDAARRTSTSVVLDSATRLIYAQEADALDAVLARLEKCEKDAARLDWLAKQCLRFEFAISKPWTPPADSCIAGGPYTWRTSWTNYHNPNSSLRYGIDSSKILADAVREGGDDA